MAKKNSKSVKKYDHVVGQIDRWINEERKKIANSRSEIKVLQKLRKEVIREPLTRAYVYIGTLHRMLVK